MALLATLSRLRGRTPPPAAEVLEAYAHVVIPVLDRAEWLYQYWLEQSTLFTDSETLGNVAAVHRWETATMGHSLEGVTAPAVLARAHADVVEALEIASRAAQMLSHGSRYHSANAVCEGQTLLTASRERRIVAMRTMRRYLLDIPPTQEAELLPELVIESEEPAEQPVGLDDSIAPPDATVSDAPLDAPAGDAPVGGSPEKRPPTPAPVSAEPSEPAAPAPVSAEPSEPAAQAGWGSLFGPRRDRTGE